MLTWITLAAPLLLAAPDKGELTKLQGRWQVVRQEHGGKKSEPKAIANLTMELKDVKMVVRDGVDIKEESRVTALPAKGTPRPLDLKIAAGADLDKEVKAIWKLEGDLLTVCVGEPGKDRPKEFAAKEGTGHTLLVFKRLAR